MSSRLLALALDAHDPDRLARFWGDLLDREVVEDPRGPLLPGTPTQVGLRFTRNDTEKVGQNRTHLHLTSTDLADQQRIVELVLGLGGRHVDVGQLPEDTHVVLGDPEDNELCVIEPGNRFLADCGFLAELAGEGMRDVGLFWAAALDWPLVWDQQEETAVQSRAGGTKVAWGGPPLPVKHGRNRQRLELVTDDPDLEAERLVGLGATRAGGVRDGEVELADPDGHEFSLLRE